ncbi:DUF6879 family protein [Streptomyces uncialis]|uniref:DUF6879 family protein n=1 Tax=Streptomyces uncialis TaxID=1048205 RepID=UPI0037AC9701
MPRFITFDEFDGMFSTLKHSAWRLESRRRYAWDETQDTYQRFSRGEAVEWDLDDPWCVERREQTALGKRFERVRVLDEPPELELSGLPSGCTRDSAGEHVSRYSTTGHYFYLLNGGEAVNFLHGASVGPFIFLVQAEILAGASMLARRGLDAGLHGVPTADREAIAATWLHYCNR